MFSIRRFFKDLGRELGKMILAFLLVGILFFGFSLGFAYWQDDPINSFCGRVTAADTPESVISMAKREGLPADDLKSQNMVVVMNHLSPFFRMACRVTFENGHVTKKEVIADD